MKKNSNSWRRPRINFLYFKYALRRLEEPEYTFPVTFEKLLYPRFWLNFNKTFVHVTVLETKRRYRLSSVEICTRCPTTMHNSVFIPIAPNRVFFFEVALLNAKVVQRSSRNDAFDHFPTNRHQRTFHCRKTHRATETRVTTERLCILEQATLAACGFVAWTAANFSSRFSIPSRRVNDRTRLVFRSEKEIYRNIIQQLWIEE